MPVVAGSSHGPEPEEIAEAIARKNGWTAPSNVIALVAVLIAAASLIVGLLR